MRRAAFPAAPVAVAPAPALVPAAVASTLVAIARFAPVSLLASLAVDAIARPGIPVFPPLLARLRRRRAVCHNRRSAFAGRCGLGPAEILVTIATPMPVTLALGAIGGFARGGFASRGRLRAIGRTIRATMPLTIVTLWSPFVGAAAGAPYLDQFSLLGCCRRLSRRCVARARRFRRCLSRTRLGRRFGGSGCSLDGLRHFRCCFARHRCGVGRHFGCVRLLREIDLRQQRRR